MVKSIDVKSLYELLKGSEKIVLIDCREKDEYEYCRIEGSQLIPLSQFSERALKELNPENEIYIHCHHGGRSRRACEFLEENGFKNTTNVVGGIDAWSLSVDPSVPRY